MMNDMETKDMDTVDKPTNTYYFLEPKRPLSQDITFNSLQQDYNHKDVNEEFDVSTPKSGLNKSVYFSSCENLRKVENRQFLDPYDCSYKIAKASSDNPLQSLGDSPSVVPPIPPRDYLWHAVCKSPKSTEIHPVLQDGEKLSNTHYWLLPNKANDFRINARIAKKDDYLNFSDAHNQNLTQLNSLNSKNKHFKMDFVGKLLCDGHTANEDEESLLDHSDTNNAYDNYSTEFSPSNNLLNVNNRQIWNQNYNQISYDDQQEPSMKEAKHMIEKVQTSVEGVTFDECQTALSMFQWNVEAAVKYLKVENLFRLALAPREFCRKILEQNDWDLNKAASNLLDCLKK